MLFRSEEEEEEEEEVEMAIEWLMVTRSDPGGSVPRFMVEKGTPGGIVSDAGRFLKWSSRYRNPALSASSEVLLLHGRNHADFTR